MSARVRLIRDSLLEWFDAHRREMPWRATKDPYHIWLSEVMLQQTQVATVIPYFERFVSRFPTPEALAEAPQEDVMKAWEGLGYYSRARNLQAAAGIVAREHAGRLPADWARMRALPGVGDYTAGAVLSIAHGVRVPAVDGNVLRVVSRLERLHADIALPATKKAITAIAADWVPGDRPGDFNQALMELGATVCVPGKPRCERCPLEGTCQARAAGEAEKLPVKAKKKPVPTATLAVGVVARAGELLVERRPATGIWGGLWGFPTAEVTGASPQEALAETLAARGLALRFGAPIATVRHTLTHRRLVMPVCLAEARVEAPPGTRWVPSERLADLALPVPFQKVAGLLDAGPLFRA